MVRSIRGRLQLWYALVLFAVVIGFAALLFYRARAARWEEVDARLQAAALYLDVQLRRFPPHELNATLPDRPGPPPRPMPRPGPPIHDPRPTPHDPGPPHPPRKRLLSELAPPQEPASSEPRRYFAVWRSDGSLLKSANLPDGIDLATLPPAARHPHPSLSWRGDSREAVLVGPFESRILVGQSVRPELDELSALAWRLAGVGAVVLVVGLTGGWLISARLLRPIAAISTTAASISATNLSGRIDTASVDRELAELATVLNSTFARLEAAFERQTRFTADASHELRTPLAIIRTHAELALSRPRSPEEYRDTLASCLRATTRMTALVEGLLTLARADAGRLEMERTSVDLPEMIEEGLALLRPLAEKKEVSLSADLERVEVSGDPVRLSQVVTNLLSNAVQYNRPGGSVRVCLQAQADAVLVEVADTGCGIPPEDQPHLFERFFRVDRARARQSGGSGLGLAICKSIVEAHGGTIGCRSMLECGSTFWVRLPRG
jgi:two-component system OmpR family sensor kinase